MRVIHSGFNYSYNAIENLPSILGHGVYNRFQYMQKTMYIVSRMASRKQGISQQEQPSVSKLFFRA